MCNSEVHQGHMGLVGVGWAWGEMIYLVWCWLGPRAFHPGTQESLLLLPQLPQWCLLDTLLVYSEIKQASVNVMQASLHYLLEGGVLGKQCGIRPLMWLQCAYLHTNCSFLSISPYLAISVCFRYAK